MAALLEVSSVPTWFTDAFGEDCSTSSSPHIALGEPRAQPYFLEDLGKQAQGVRAPPWRPKGTLWFKLGFAVIPQNKRESATSVTTSPHLFTPIRCAGLGIIRFSWTDVVVAVVDVGFSVVDVVVALSEL